MFSPYCGLTTPSTCCWIKYHTWPGILDPALQKKTAFDTHACTLEFHNKLLGLSMLLPLYHQVVEYLVSDNGVHSALKKLPGSPLGSSLCMKKKDTEFVWDLHAFIHFIGCLTGVWPPVSIEWVPYPINKPEFNRSLSIRHQLRVYPFSYWNMFWQHACMTELPLYQQFPMSLKVHYNIDFYYSSVSMKHPS